MNPEAEVDIENMAADMIANAIDAGWQYTECPRCPDTNGWFGRLDRVETCPVCGERLEFLMSPVYNPATGALLAYEYYVVGLTKAEKSRSRRKAKSAAQRKADAYGSCVATTGFGWRVSTAALPPCTCGEAH